MNTILPGEAQRIKGTGVCDRESVSLGRGAQEHRVGTQGQGIGLELEGDWEGGLGSLSHDQPSAVEGSIGEPLILC